MRLTYFLTCPQSEIQTPSCNLFERSLPSFDITLKEPAKVIGIDMPAGTLLHVRKCDDRSPNPSGKERPELDYVTHAEPPKGKSIFHQGYKCTAMDFNYGDLKSCDLVNGLKMKGYTIPAGSNIYFDSSKKKGGIAMPAILYSLKNPIVVNGNNIEISSGPYIIKEDDLVKEGALVYFERLAKNGQALY